MNKYSNQLIICDDIPNKLNLNDENILFWNGYSDNKKSILSLIENNSLEIKKEINEELDSFHSENHKILEKIDIKIDKKVNYWSINSMIDNNNIFDQIFINDYIKFFQLKKIIKKKKIDQIDFFTSDNELKKIISNFEKKLDIKINVIEKKKKIIVNKKYIKKLFHPLLLAIPIFFIFLFKRKKYYLSLKKNEHKKRKNLFVNYLFGSNFNRGNLNSNYWGNLDTTLENNKIERTWLHIALSEDKSIDEDKELFNKLNVNPLSEHLVLDSFFNFKTFFTIIFIWTKIVWNANKINNNLEYNIKDKFLYSLFKSNFKENIFGYKFLINLYYFKLFELFLNNESNFKNCFYLYENQSWERSLIYNLNIHSSETNKYGLIHSSVRFWDLRYVKMNYLYNNPNLEKFSHNKIFVSSEKFKKILLDNNFNSDQIIVTETLGFEYISNFEESPSLEKNKDYVVILGDYNKNINKKIEFCIKLLSKNDRYRVICKPHPLNDFKNELYNIPNLKKSSDTAKDLSKIYNNFIVSNSSTVGLELYLTGRNVITVLNDEFINYSPLKHYYNYQNYVYDINQIEHKIDNDIKNYVYPDFFEQNTNFKRWIKIINND